MKTLFLSPLYLCCSRRSDHTPACTASSQSTASLQRDHLCFFPLHKAYTTTRLAAKIQLVHRVRHAANHISQRSCAQVHPIEAPGAGGWRDFGHGLPGVIVKHVCLSMLRSDRLCPHPFGNGDNGYVARRSAKSQARQHAQLMHSGANVNASSACALASQRSIP